MVELTSEETQNYELLKALEILGGSEEYKRNPEAFDAVLPECLKEDIDQEERKQRALAAIDKFASEAKSSDSPINEGVVKEFKTMTIKRLDENRVTKEQRNLRILRAMERLGGSAGFLRYVEEKANSENPLDPPPIPTGWEKCLVYGEIFSKVLMITYLWIVGDVRGDGEAWGVGVGEGEVVAWCEHAGTSVLMSTVNDFIVQSVALGAGRVDAICIISQSPVAHIYGDVQGSVISDGREGWIEWY